LCKGAPSPLPQVDIYSWDGVNLSLTTSVTPTVTKANGTEATFTVPIIPAGTYRIRYRYNGSIASATSPIVLTVSSPLPSCTPTPTLSVTAPSNIYLGSVISGTATNATSVTATVGGQTLVNTGTATSFSFTITNQVYNPLFPLTVTATRAIPGVCSANSVTSSTLVSVSGSSFGTPSAITLPVGVGGSVSVPGNGLLGNFFLVPSTVVNYAVDVSQDILITATAPGGTTPAVLNIPATVPAGSYYVRLINALHPSPGITTSSAFITVASVPPTITSVSPSLITSATGTLTITGNNFLGATAVAFGTASIPYVSVSPSSFTVVNNTTITVPFSAIPSFNGARNVRVTTPSDTAISTVTVSRPTLTLTSFSPSFAARNSSPTINNGTIITISGSGLSGLNTSYVVEFQTSTSGAWTQGVPGILSAGVPNPTLSVNAAGTIVYIRAPHNAVTGRIRLRSLIGGNTVVSTTNINLIGTTPAGWSAEEENNGGETDNVQIIGGADSSSATLFPNPTSDAVSVTTQGFTGEVTISLMDMMGATIETKAVSAGAEAQFNLANRQRGVYVIRLTDEAGHTELRRVVKE